MCGDKMNIIGEQTFEEQLSEEQHDKQPNMIWRKSELANRRHRRSRRAPTVLTASEEQISAASMQADEATQLMRQCLRDTHQSSSSCTMTHNEHTHRCETKRKTMHIKKAATRITRNSNASHSVGGRRRTLIFLATCALFAAICVAASSNASRSGERALLRSANVELARRRSSRLQRDTDVAVGFPTSAASSTTSPQQVQQVTQPSAPTCGYPGSPAHASVTFNTSHVLAGTAATYTCDNGYELLGPPKRVCQANGTWSPVGIPFCGKCLLFDCCCCEV